MCNSEKEDRRLLLIRHATSLKTLHHKHGGPGEPLTADGKSDAARVGTFISENFLLKNAKIFGSQVMQVSETAKIISDVTGIPFELDNRLRNIYMGVFDGLSNEEIQSCYPEPAKQLQMWRDGKLDVSNVHIPNAETMDMFKDRVNNFMTDLLGKKSIELPIVVITRSVGVAITNYLLSESELKGKPYSRYKFDPSSISLFTLTTNHKSLIYQNRTDFLGYAVEFPDD